VHAFAVRRSIHSRSAPSVRSGLFALLLGLSGIPLNAAGGEPGRDLVVQVKQSGDRFTIDVSMHVDAPLIDVWNVLTDFERMAQIVSNLESSRIVSRQGSRVVVEQRGSETQGLLKFAFHSVRNVELEPHGEMRSTLISGSMRRLDGVTRLVATDRGTRVISLGELVPDSWIPPLVGAHFLEKATRKQYVEMRDEMLRRSRAANH
jgi:Polyketide cyclase / dehydrase and lipid transport